MIEEALRFIAPPDHAKRLTLALASNNAPLSVRTLTLELASMRAIRDICVSHEVQFEVVGIDTFLLNPRPQGITLLLDADLEPILYSPYWDPPLPVDGQQASRIVADKFRTYRMLRQTQSVRQPKTALVNNHRDLERALATLTSQLIVVKPRSDSDSAQNVLIVDRDRLKSPQHPELMNFTNAIVQEYPSLLLSPPVEWRLHYVGRTLCRCLRTVDKHSWQRSFSSQDIAIGSLPNPLLLQASEAIACLIPPASRDNIAIDFLEAEDGFYFLEANCGALGSFYVDDCHKGEVLSSIFETLFRRYFKRPRRHSLLSKQ